MSRKSIKYKRKQKEQRERRNYVQIYKQISKTHTKTQTQLLIDSYSTANSGKYNRATRRYIQRNQGPFKTQGEKGREITKALLSDVPNLRKTGTEKQQQNYIRYQKILLIRELAKKDPKFLELLRQGKDVHPKDYGKYIDAKTKLSEIINKHGLKVLTDKYKKKYSLSGGQKMIDELEKLLIDTPK